MTQKDKFSWDDKAVRRIIDLYPIQVQDRLYELHPTSTIIYHAYDQVTKERVRAGYETTKNPTLREVTAYIGRAFGVPMQFGNIHKNHLPGLLEVGLLKREKAPDGVAVPRSIGVVDPNELEGYDPPTLSTSRDRPSSSMWDDLHRPTTFQIQPDGDLVRME